MAREHAVLFVLVLAGTVNFLDYARVADQWLTDYQN